MISKCLKHVIVVLVVSIILLSRTKANVDPEAVIGKFAYAQTKSEIFQYANAVIFLTKNPGLWDIVPPGEMEKMPLKVSGVHLKMDISKEEWNRLEKSETLLLGQMTQSLERRVDPSINTERMIVSGYQTYEEAVPEEQRNDKAKKEYERRISQLKKQDLLESDQVKVQRALKRVAFLSKYYLSKLYTDSVDPVHDETAILVAGGIDRKVIDMLTKP